MKLIIDISEDDLQEVKEYGIHEFPSLAKSIQNGIPLEDELDRIMREIDDLKWTSMAVDFRNEVFEIIEENKQ